MGRIGCEVCAEAASRESATCRIRFEDRVVTLCEKHAALVRRSGVTTLEGARAIFRRHGERRSELPRRARLDRRVFPPRPEGRRHGDGRRLEDVA